MTSSCSSSELHPWRSVTLGGIGRPHADVSFLLLLHMGVESNDEEVGLLPMLVIGIGIETKYYYGDNK